VKTQALLVALGIALIAIATALGGRAAGIGGGVALVAQVWAVALLRPKMRAPNPEFMARWLGGMAIRFLALAALIVWSVTHRAEFPVLQTAGGFLGVLLPLLFLETRFLK
jgi:predicted transporter